jgi:hypothetical protein
MIDIRFQKYINLVYYEIGTDLETVMLTRKF